MPAIARQGNVCAELYSQTKAVGPEAPPALVGLSILDHIRRRRRHNLEKYRLCADALLMQMPSEPTSAGPSR
jgi:hypothetical protein